MSSKFSTNVVGKINEIRLDSKQGYFSLLEVISNSIYSIQKSKVKNGRIDIYIARDLQYQTEIGKRVDEQNKNAYIKSIRVIDNGEGFTNDNFNSFLTCYSDYKSKDGGKGVGRFTCLKVFDFVSIKSTYSENSKYITRMFDFYPKNELENENLKIDGNQSLTEVSLNSLKGMYSIDFPTDLNTLADIIIEHFFINFITDNIPHIFLHDEFNGDLNVNDYYAKDSEYDVNKELFKIHDIEFEIYHIKSYSIKKSNKAFLCANLRNTAHIDLRKYIYNLQSNISTKGDKKRWYFSYVTSKYLDEHVNSERTRFNFPSNDKQAMGFVDICENTLTDSIVEVIANYLKKELEEIEKEKIARIDYFIDTRCPKYRKMREYRPDFYKNIPNEYNEIKLDMALYKEQQNWELEIKKQGKALFSKSKKYDPTQLEKLKQEYLENVSAIGKSSLTDYIVKRKAIIDLLNNSLSQNTETNRYSLEEVVHKLICPMITTSDELDYDDMNLWLIDERLSYHYYLASDKTFKSQATLDTNSTKETDLAIYHSSLIFNNMPLDMPFSALTIIEFKRPMRDDYTNNENPIDQVKNYIVDLRSGNAKDRRGRILSGAMESLPIYVYIIADITKSLKSLCIKDDFTQTPDNEGYFKYHTNLKAYVEIISYKKLVDNATQRNKILFDKLFQQ